MPPGVRRPHRRLKGEVPAWLELQRGLKSSYRHRLRREAGHDVRDTSWPAGDSRRDPAFKQAYRTYVREQARYDKEEAARRAGKPYRGVRADTSPEGLWANALIVLGRRQVGDYWDVGQTPRNVSEARGRR